MIKLTLTYPYHKLLRCIYTIQYTGKIIWNINNNIYIGYVTYIGIPTINNLLFLSILFIVNLCLVLQILKI